MSHILKFILIKTYVLSCPTTITSPSTIEAQYNPYVRKRELMVSADPAYLRGDKSTTQANDEQHGKSFDHFHLVIQAKYRTGRGATVHISLDHQDTRIKLAPPRPDVQYRQGVT